MARLKRFGHKILEGFERYGKQKAAERLAVMGYRKEAEEILKTL